MKGMLVGGSAAPRAMIAGFKQRHGLSVVHGWGMTETSPVASTAQLPGDARRGRRRDAVRLHRDAGPAAAARRAAPPRRRGQRSCRGTASRWASSRSAARGSPARYYDTPEQADRWTDDGWFKTGDVVVDPPARLHPDQGPLEGRDQVGRRVDLVGRARERADGAPRDRRGGGDRGARREVGRAAARGRRAAGGRVGDGARSCATFLAPNFAKWWLPDRFEFVAEIPKTSVGKFRKTELREMFASEPAVPS